MSAKILYSDDSIIVCVKPVGVESEAEGMPQLLQQLCPSREIYCVHRLDKAVGGVMVYAREKKAAASLSAQVSERKMRKRYVAVVSGCPQENEARLKDLLYRDAAKNKSYVVKRMRRGVKEAELEYRLLQSDGGISLLDILLHTGRSHQIRVQFSSRGMPLLGDIKYGSSERDCSIALWSYSLGFAHPKSGRQMEFSALPETDKYPWNKFDFLKEDFAHGEDI